MERSPPKEAGEAPKPRRQVLPPVRPSRLEESEATRGNVLINYCLNRRVKYCDSDSRGWVVGLKGKGTVPIVSPGHKRRACESEGCQWDQITGAIRDEGTKWLGPGGRDIGRECSG